MNKYTLLKAGLAAALVIMLPGLSSADNDKCRNVRFRVTNEHSTGKEILITAIEYHDVVNDREVTKGITNVVCNIHKTCLTNDKDLADVEGTNIKNIRFVYKYREEDTDWSDKVTSKAFDANNATCRADRIYGPAPQGFVITGT